MDSLLKGKNPAQGVWYELNENGKISIEVPDLSACKGRQPVLVDDIASSGRTLIEAARQIGSQGFAKPVYVAVDDLFAVAGYTVPSVLAGPARSGAGASASAGQR